MNLFKKKFFNLGYHFKLSNTKILRYNSHNNDIKVTFNNKTKVFRKETNTSYGKKLIQNEISGIKWYSNRNEDIKKKFYNQKITKKKSFIEIKEFEGKKISYLKPLTKTYLKILKVIKFYSDTWPKGKNVPCHGDFTLDNIIFSKKKINVIDWECFNQKGEFWGYDIAYLVLSAATFPYYKKGRLPKKDQKILIYIWKKLKALGLDRKILRDPVLEFKKTFKKSHWKIIVKRSPKKLYPMFIKKNFSNHINSIINLI